MQFADRLWIIPSHHKAPDPSAINILLDPGLAFGTGTHPTTAMCLTQLSKLVSDNPHTLHKVIDYGCGSGILAIAAVKLGADRVIAVDNDPQALLATDANAQQNQVNDRIETYLPAQEPNDQVDLLMANILSGPLINLAEHFSRQVHPGGHLILSGILQTQKQDVRTAYQHWFAMTREQQIDDWICLIGTRLEDQHGGH